MHVLIVEDERKTSAHIKHGLEEQGYAVDATYTGCDRPGCRCTEEKCCGTGSRRKEGQPTSCHRTNSNNE